MRNKYNSRNNIFKKDYTEFRQSNAFVEVEVITDPNPSNTHIFIADWNGIVVSFPINLLRANDLVIQKGKLKISQSIYDAWFKDKLNEELQELSKKVYSHFDKIVQHSNTILNDEEYRNIRLPFMKTTILYSCEFHYTLGALLDSWMHNDDLMVAPFSYLLKLNVSPSSGLNNYTAYSTVNKSLFVGSLPQKKEYWMGFVGKFQSIASAKRNKSDILALTRLLFELEIL
jgi:hypothetical protein